MENPTSLALLALDALDASHRTADIAIATLDALDAVAAERDAMDGFLAGRVDLRPVLRAVDRSAAAWSRLANLHTNLHTP